MPLRVLIRGANGFIGSSLTHAILKRKDWEVYGMDVGDHKLGDCLGNPRFRFVERSEEHTSELQSLRHFLCRLLLEKKETGRRLLGLQYWGAAWRLIWVAGVGS